MPVANTTGEHTLEATVAGPDSADRQITITGAANVSTFIGANQQKTETWTFLVGPALTRKQFHRAIGTAAISSQSLNIQTVPANYQTAINSVEADWDDESGKVEVRVELNMSTNAGVSQVFVNQLRYYVTVLAQS
jgi:hypothetical protein